MAASAPGPRVLPEKPKAASYLKTFFSFPSIFSSPEGICVLFLLRLASSVPSECEAQGYPRYTEPGDTACAGEGARARPVLTATCLEPRTEVLASVISAQGPAGSCREGVPLLVRSLALFFTHYLA